MAFLRSLATTTAIAASALPAVFALSSSSQSFRFPKPQNLSFLSSPNPKPLFLTTSFTNSPSALHMDAPTSEQNPPFRFFSDAVLPELMTEYMVDMKCEGCVNAVKNKLQIVDGVKSVEVDLETLEKYLIPSTEGVNKPLGDLGTLDTDENGNAFFSGVKEKLRVLTLLGGENYKKLCTCDGTTIWESSDKDFVTSKV
ncbi:hypothetical protein M0R45_024576 [Rubus argutus]|uniref:HMA domain-containing protein n=1 Tax=Rubus argutus TaxID=59490 RepID=A0AAW1WVH6_RUBAR